MTLLLPRPVPGLPGLPCSPRPVTDPAPAALAEPPGTGDEQWLGTGTVAGKKGHRGDLGGGTGCPKKYRWGSSLWDKPISGVFSVEFPPHSIGIHVPVTVSVHRSPASVTVPVAGCGGGFRFPTAPLQPLFHLGHCLPEAVTGALPGWWAVWGRFGRQSGCNESAQCKERPCGGYCGRSGHPVTVPSVGGW